MMIPLREGRMRMTSAADWATDGPRLMCIPMLAWARAMASLVPSPQKRIVFSFLELKLEFELGFGDGDVERRCWIYVCLSIGLQRERVCDSGIPSKEAVRLTEFSLSPLMRDTSMWRS